MSEQPSPRPRKRTIAPSGIPDAQLKPWLAPECDPSDIYALQAVYNGRATDEQQRRAMDFIIKELCGVNRSTFVPGPDGQRASDLAQGKQLVGHVIVSLLTVRINPRGEQP